MVPDGAPYTAQSCSSRFSRESGCMQVSVLSPASVYGVCGGSLARGNCANHLLNNNNNHYHHNNASMYTRGADRYMFERCVESIADRSWLNATRQLLKILNPSDCIGDTSGCHWNKIAAKTHRILLHPANAVVDYLFIYRGVVQTSHEKGHQPLSFPSPPLPSPPFPFPSVPSLYT